MGRLIAGDAARQVGVDGLLEVRERALGVLPLGLAALHAVDVEQVDLDGSAGGPARDRERRHEHEAGQPEGSRSSHAGVQADMTGEIDCQR